MLNHRVKVEKLDICLGQRCMESRFLRSAVPCNNIFKMIIFVFLYPLHVSALIGHPEAEYTIT
jgi:hypothetical protein